AMEIAERINSQPMRAEAMANLALALQASGKMPEARRLIESAIPVARSCNHAPALVAALTFHGLYHNFGSQYEQAEALELEARSLASNAREGLYLPLSHFYLGVAQTNLGKFDAALSSMNQGLEIARRNGNKMVLARMPNALGFVYRELGDLPKAVEYDR